MSVVPVTNAQVEEVIVSTRKREENLQKVPIAVTALGAEQIERLQICPGLAGLFAFVAEPWRGLRTRVQSVCRRFAQAVVDEGLIP